MQKRKECGTWSDGSKFPAPFAIQPSLYATPLLPPQNPDNQFKTFESVLKIRPFVPPVYLATNVKVYKGTIGLLNIKPSPTPPATTVNDLEAPLAPAVVVVSTGVPADADTAKLLPDKSGHVFVATL